MPRWLIRLEVWMNDRPATATVIFLLLAILIMIGATLCLR